MAPGSEGQVFGSSGEYPEVRLGSAEGAGSDLLEADGEHPELLLALPVADDLEEERCC